MNPGIREFVGDQIQGSAFYEFMSAVKRKLPPGTPDDLIEQSLYYLLGRTLTDDELFSLAWRLAGNLRSFRQLRPVVPWTYQHEFEWVPVQVLRGDPYLTRRSRKAGTIFQFQILAGSPCPLTTSQFWSRAMCRMIARRIGFTPTWRKYPFRNPLQLVNLQLYVQLDPERSKEDEPRFFHVHEEQPSSVINWNRQVMRMRRREAGFFDCPENHPASLACHQCHVGLDQCAAAVHDQTFEWSHCRNCRRLAWHDPDHPRICVSCRIGKILNPERNSDQPR